MNFCALICISADFLLPSSFHPQKLEGQNREFQSLMMIEKERCKFFQLHGKWAICEKVLSWQIIQVDCANVKSIFKCQKEANECTHFIVYSFIWMGEVVTLLLRLVGMTGCQHGLSIPPPLHPPYPTLAYSKDRARDEISHFKIILREFCFLSLPSRVRTPVIFIP